jgi:isopentenyldiphosphate isomerase
MTLQQNDPTELLEVYDAAGRATGIARSRAEIHLNGNWHKAFHCWILRRGGHEVVLQRRSLMKDTFAGLWDAAAAGHWRFGESAEEASREIAEELGIAVRFEDLVYRGRERAARRFANGLIDREFHEVYVLEDDRPLSAYRPDPSEVIALAAFPLPQLLEVAALRVERWIASTEAVTVEADGRVEPTNVVLSRQELVPYRVVRLRRNLVARDRVDRIRKLWLRATRTRRLPSAPA